MAFVAVDKSRRAFIYHCKPVRENGVWVPAKWPEMYLPISKGAVIKLIGRDMDWYDEPVEVV
jgi:hypothetical protein